MLSCSIIGLFADISPHWYHHWCSVDGTSDVLVSNWNSPFTAQERGSESEVLLCFSWPAACWYRCHGNTSRGGIPVSPGTQTYISAGAPLTRRLHICYCDSVPTGGSVFPPERDRERELQWPARFSQRSLSPHCQRTQQAATKRSPSCFRPACHWARLLNASRRRMNPEWLKWPFGVFVCW